MIYFLVKFRGSGNIYILYGEKRSARIVDVVRVGETGSIRPVGDSVLGINKNDHCFLWVKTADTYEEMKQIAVIEAL